MYFGAAVGGRLAQVYVTVPRPMTRNCHSPVGDGRVFVPANVSRAAKPEDGTHIDHWDRMSYHLQEALSNLNRREVLVLRCRIA